MTKAECPPVNIVKDRRHYDLEVALPGFKKEEISLAVQGRTLTIVAQKDRVIHGHGVIQREFAGQTQHRRFRLPRSVDTDDIQATLQEGILHVRLSYEPTATTATISVQ